MDARVCKVLIVMLLAGLVLVLPAAAATTSITVKKLADDGATVLAEVTKDYTWMMNNLPPLGDGSTHYYHQGPVYVNDPNPVVEEELRWNAAEDTNVLEHDMGAVKGTNLKDLCDLVGGMNEGETVTIMDPVGFSKTFAYKNVYEYSAREGPMVITWYQDGKYPDTGYDNGMRLVWFADDSVNTLGPDGTGVHAFGNYDWKLAAAPEYWYYREEGTERYPTTTGLSVYHVSDIIINSDNPPPELLFDGTVTLTKDATFTQVAKSGSSYTVQEDTPLGALRAAAVTADSYPDFTYAVTDSNYATKGVLLLDDVDGYTYKNPGKWYAYVNGVYKDGWANPADGLNVFEVVDGDKIEFYYATGITNPADLITVETTATAAVKTVADIPPPEYPVAKFHAEPLTGFAPLSVQFTDESTGTAPLSYDWDFQNDGTVDSHEQSPSFSYDAVGKYTVKLIVTNSLGSDDELKADYITVQAPSADWTLSLTGARTETVTKSYFEEGMVHAPDTHYKDYTDAGGTWSGMPLYLLLGMVDDNPDPGTPYHYNFNDALATQGYNVKITASDGYTVTLSSKDIENNLNWFIVANKLNGEYLPATDDSVPPKPIWPLKLKGTGVEGGNQIGGIVKIELIGIPQPPPTGWTLKLIGDVTDTITQAEFEAAVAHGHTASWTDSSSNVYTGVPLWYLVGAVDDLETTDHWTFNDNLAATNYEVQVWDLDTEGNPPKPFSASFYSQSFARSDAYILANKKNGADLPATEYPLRLVGSGTTSGKQRVSKVDEILIPSLVTPAPAPGSYNLALVGKISDVLSQAELEAAINCPEHQRTVSVTDKYGNTALYRGMPLWNLAGWVDDRIPHGPDGFNAAQAAAGYKIIVADLDSPYSKDFSGSAVAWSDDYIIANQKSTDGGATFVPLSGSEWPLRIVGAGAKGGYSVSGIDSITLTDFGAPVVIPTLHIVKYGPDRTTVVSEATIDYTQMMTFPVIGDGTTLYKFQGVTMDPTDPWGQSDETKGGAKISNAVKGTRLSDLVSLVGGMGEGTDLVTLAPDGYEITLPYSSVYASPTVSPEIYQHQGYAILAWYADGKYVPGYADGMRLYFMPEDHIFGQWDMHESLPAGYWHYYYQAYLPPSPYAPGILYPSAAGLSNKNVVELHVYTTPEKPWTLELDGTRIGGISYTVDKAFFESALACQQGANHEATYTDSSGNVWVGMPLWFLAGFVDDADQHSSNAYNDAKALAGYEIVVIGSGSYTKVFPSAPTVRSDAFIVANTKSGAHIPDTDTKNWPLKLVGTGVASSGKLQVGGINTIILNYPPVPETITVPSPVDVGSMVAAGGTFSDPYDAIGHTVTWDWGDGSPATPGTVDEAANSVSGSHVYTALGTYNVKFTITDQPGSGKTSSEATVVVQNVLPIVISVAVPTTPVLTGTPITASATFTDVLDTHTATWAWGDGSTSTGVVDETAMAVTGSHTYTVPGLLTVTLTLTDGSGATATKSSQYMIVYDPKSGFVTGLGSIASPAGAYAANPSLTGPATIELLARYPVVMNKPFTGVTAFQFLKAKMSFVSTSYDWLVIQKDAKKAFYKGSGQIGGKGDYGFLAAVIDGGSKPAQDKFRIKIWDKATGNVVYDTQPGAADTADPTTPLTLGGLVVDKLLG